MENLISYTQLIVHETNLWQYEHRTANFGKNAECIEIPILILDCYHFKWFSYVL